MLLRKSTSALFVLMALVLASVPGTAAPQNECGLVPSPNVPNGYVGRPCVQLDMQVSDSSEATCATFTVPVVDEKVFDFGRDPICTFYFILVPLTDGNVDLDPAGGFDTEVDTAIVYAETNGVPGLQTITSPGVTERDQPVLL